MEEQGNIKITIREKKKKEKKKKEEEEEEEEEEEIAANIMWQEQVRNERPLYVWSKKHLTLYLRLVSVLARAATMSDVRLLLLVCICWIWSTDASKHLSMTLACLHPI